MPRVFRASKLDDLVSRSLDLRDRTRDLYRECVEAFVIFAGNDPRQYTPGLVEDWLFELLKERLPQTVNVYRKAIRYASRQWAKRGTRQTPNEDFAANVDKVKAKTAAKRVPLTDTEVAELLETCASNTPIDVRDRALLVLAFRSGLRRGGICALTVENIQPPMITTINKGGDLITFTADNETLEQLALWLTLLRESGHTRGCVFRNVHPTAGIGKPLSPFQIWSMFRSRAKRAGVRHTFPHLARHTIITKLREAGTSSAEVGTLTGQTERTIEDIYTHPRVKGAVGDVIPSLFKKKNKS
jgi:integrase/recombinase XerC